MVSLDEQIQKDKQKQKSQRSQKKFSPPNQRRTQKFSRAPSDKRRTIRKDDRRRYNRKFDRLNRQSRVGGPRRDNRQDDREARRQTNRITRGKNDRRRISRPPRKQSKQVTENAPQQKGRTLKVMGLHPDFTNEDLYKLFSTEGALQKCLIQQDNFGRSLTTAIVKYHNASSAKSAIANLNQHKVMNSILTVEPYKNKRR